MRYTLADLPLTGYTDYPRAGGGIDRVYMYRVSGRDKQKITGIDWTNPSSIPEMHLLLQVPRQ